MARNLRKRPTRAEKVLWETMKSLHPHGFPVGSRFRRQVVVLGWIADFYHPYSRTVIEVDGGYHFATHQQIEKDLRRDSTMRAHLFMVLRFTNDQVLKNPGEVVKKIILSISDRQKTAESEALWRRAVPLTGKAATVATKSRAT